jgi:hypothetical protein
MNFRHCPRYTKAPRIQAGRVVATKKRTVDHLLIAASASVSLPTLPPWKSSTPRLWLGNRPLRFKAALKRVHQIDDILAGGRGHDPLRKLGLLFLQFR